MTKKVFINAEGKPATSITERVALRTVFDDGTFSDFDPSKCSEETRLTAMWHGFSQKHGDSYAGAAKAENPLSFTKEAVRDTSAQLYRNEWRVIGEARVSDLAQALARVTGDSVEEAHAFVEELSDEEKKAYRAKKKVAAALAAIAAEKAAEKAKRLAAKAAEKSEDEEVEEEEEEISIKRA